jgi:hypothetical protein
MDAALRTALESLQKEFQRAALAYPAIYHQMLLVDPGSREMTSESWWAFARANTPAKDGGWQEWHGPVEGKVLDWFGRFYGGAAGLTEFKQLAQSLYLVIQQMDRRLQKKGNYEECLDLLHEVAANWPTYLVRSEEGLWDLEENLGEELADDEDIDEDRVAAIIDQHTRVEEATATDDQGVEYPLHPFVETIQNNLFSAVGSFIQMILDDEKTLFVSDVHLSEPDYPVLDGRTEQAEPTVTEEMDRDHSDYLFALDPVRRVWHVRYRWGNGPDEVEECFVPDKKQVQYVAYMLQRPEEWIQCTRMLPPPKVDQARSVVNEKDGYVQYDQNYSRRLPKSSQDEEEKRWFLSEFAKARAEIGEARKEGDRKGEEDAEAKFESLQREFCQKFDKWGRPRRRLTNVDLRAANRVRRGIEECLAKFSPTGLCPCPHLLEHLKKIEVSQGRCFYAPGGSAIKWTVNGLPEEG